VFGLGRKKFGWSRGRPRVIVVGAGLSGLLAAVRLAEAGADVTVLEEEDRVGGRIHSVPLGGSHVNLGAQYFFHSGNDYLDHYIRKASKFSPEGGKLGALWNGTLASASGEELFLSLPIERQALEHLDRATKRMREARKELMRGKEFVFDKEPTSPLWWELDRITATEYLFDFHPDVANIFDTFLIPEGGVGTSQTSALLLVGWYGGPERQTHLIDGGNQKLPEAIAEDIKKLGGRLHLSTEVIRVSNTEYGVDVESSNGRRLEADYAIVTVPAPVAQKIVQSIPVEKQEALAAAVFGGSMQVGLHLRNLPKDDRINSCFFHNSRINAYMDQTRGDGDSETVVSLNIAGEEAHALTEDEILDRVAEPLKQIYPGFDPATSIVESKMRTWANGIVRYPPGLLSKHHDQLRAPVGNVHFGGDYTHNPALDGAAWSGIRSAEQVLSRAKEALA